MNTSNNRFLALEEAIKHKKQKKSPSAKPKKKANPYRANGGVTIAQNAPQINFEAGINQGVVSDYTRGVLLEIMVAAGVNSLRITSTARTPEQQARAMYNNLENRGVEDQLALYAAPGDAVIQAYVASKNQNNSEAQIIADMVAEILNQGPGRVSRHAANPAELNVIDISPASVGNRPAFEAAVRADNRVSRFLTPADNDPAYHLEIPQPGAPAPAVDQQSLMLAMQGAHNYGGVHPFNHVQAFNGGVPAANPEFAEAAKDLAGDILIMESYKGFHNWDDPWGFFFSKNEELQAAYDKPNWDGKVVEKYNAYTGWKAEKILKMIARDILGKKLPGKVKSETDKQTLIEAYDTWKRGYYAVFWGKGDVCNLFVGEAIYNKGYDFLNNIKHYYHPPQMDKGAGGTLVEIEFSQVEPGDFFTLANVHTGVIIEKGSDYVKTREGTVDDDDMGVIRTKRNSDSMRYWRYKKTAAGQSWSGAQSMRTKDFNMRQIAVLGVGGVGAHGTFSIDGIIIVEDRVVDYNTGAKKTFITVSANGQTAASSAGRVRFWGKVDLILNGTVFRTETFKPGSHASVHAPHIKVIGDAVFEMPAGASPSDIQLTITGGYTFNSGHGFAAPMPGSVSETYTLP